MARENRRSAGGRRGGRGRGRRISTLIVAPAGAIPALVGPRPAVDEDNATNNNIVVGATTFSADAQDMMNKKTEDSTKGNYKSKLGHFYEWISDKRPELWCEDSDDVKWVSIDNTVFPNFLADYMWKKDGGAKANSTMGNYRSALTTAYLDALNVTSLPSDMDKAVSDFFAGYKRNCAKLQDVGLMKPDEGKRGFSLKGLRLLVLHAIHGISCSRVLLVVWFNLLYTWNLAARLTSVTNLKTNCFQMGSDYFTVTFPHTKTDQTGENSWPKSIYSNPLEPSLCPFLILGLIVICNGGGLGASSSEFLLGITSSSNETFTNWLNTALMSFSDEELILMDLDRELGGQSGRKGMATYAASFTYTAITALFQRAGWTTGTMADRYISWSPGGDNIVGQLASGKNPETMEFATLPPHFKPGEAILSTQEWPSIFPGFANYPSSFKRLLPFLLASVVYHSDWLADNLPPTFCLFSTYLWTRNYHVSLRSKVHTGNYYNAETKLAASGMPTHILLMYNFKSDIKSLQTELSSVSSKLDTFKSELSAKIDNLVLSSSGNSFTSSASPTIIAASVVASVENLMSGVFKCALDQLKANLPSGGGGDEQLLHHAHHHTSSGTAVAISPRVAPLPAISSWGNMLHPVPENFKLNT